MYTKLQKVAISYIKSVCLYVCPSVCPRGKTQLPLDDFNKIWYLNICQKSVKKTQVSLNSDKNNRYFIWRPIHIFFIYCSFLLTMRNISDKICREYQNTHFMFNNCFWKLCDLWDNVEKYCRAGKATDYNMEHVHCMLDN
jgi:hypothetical protein